MVKVKRMGLHIVRGLFALYVVMWSEKPVGAADPPQEERVSRNVFSECSSESLDSSWDRPRWTVPEWMLARSEVRGLGDAVRWAGGVAVESWESWGRTAVGSIAGRGAHGTEVLADGEPVQEQDVRGCDLSGLLAEEVGELRVDGMLGRLEIIPPEERVGRPYTRVGRQVGSGGWAQTSVHFGKRIGGLSLGLFGWSGRTVDRGANRGCERQIVKVRLRRTASDGLAMTWGRSERGVPGPWTRYPARTLRDRWQALSGEACRSVGTRTRLWFRGRVDALDRRLSCPDAGKKVERDDWSARGSFGGRVQFSKRGAVRWTASMERASFEDTEGRSSSPLRSRVHMEHALRVGRDVRTGVWGEGKTHSEYGSMLDGGLWGVLPFLGGAGFMMASAARMSQWPSFDERYWSDYESLTLPSRADSLSALDLNPEHALRCWLEVGFPFDGGTVRSALFWEQDEDGIGPDPRLGGRLANLPPTACTGWEVWASSDESPVRWGLGYRYERVERTVLHRPKHRCKVWVQGSKGFFEGELEPGLFVGAEYVGTSRGYDEARGEEVSLKGALFVQVRLDVRVLEDFDAFYLVDNALDASYQSRWGYPAQGRSFRWGFVWSVWD